MAKGGWWEGSHLDSDDGAWVEVRLDEGNILSLQVDHEGAAQGEEVAKVSDVVVLEADVAVTAADVDGGGHECDVICAVELIISGVLRIFAPVVLPIGIFESCLSRCFCDSVGH